MIFREIILPDVKHAFVPDDIEIVVPSSADVPEVDNQFIHSLAYIPWSDKYMRYVPEGYKEFYKTILPKLNARTTDVHSALSVSFVDELIERSGQKTNRHTLVIATLLHDIGWAQLSPKQIALSLNYSAFTYTEEALLPKRLHASLGAEIAANVLAVDTTLDLSQDDKDYIANLVRYHDQIDPWPHKPEPSEYLLLGDADRLWSYTHENFWLDTIRKNIKPAEYLKNIAESIDNYFLTEAGREIARVRVSKLAKEVAQLDDFQTQ